MTLNVFRVCYRHRFISKSLPQNVFTRSLTSKKGELVMNVFDRKAKRLQRDRTTLLPDYKVYEYVKEEFGYRVADRVFDIKREFNTLVDLGCGRGYVSKHLLLDSVKTIYQCELSEKMLMQSEVSPEVPTYKIVADEEFFPFKDNSLDIVVSSLSLHWVNDLPGCFKQVFNALKQDGVFLGCMFGGDTLFELRVSLQLAETEREGGFAPHISPFTDVRDLGNLLNRAGYSMTTMDIDEITVVYPSIYELMKDLKGMGENNCAYSRKSMLRRETIDAADAIYKEMYPNDRGIPATFQVIYFIGWKPHPNHAKPLERGSAEASFKNMGSLDNLNKHIGDIKNLNDLENSATDVTGDKDNPNKDKT